MKSLYIPFKNFSTYVEIYGENLNSVPLIICHGGPGSGRYGFINLAKKLEKEGQKVILYDQLGAGNSIPKNEDPSFYNLNTWKEEFFNLVSYLNLSSYYALGHSYGGMLLISILVDNNPKELKKVILSSTLYSSKIREEEANRLIKFLPNSFQNIIKETNLKYEKTKDLNVYNSIEFNSASENYCSMYVKSSSKIKYKDQTFGKLAYLTAWGPSEFKCLGNLKDFDYSLSLNKINNNVLILSGGNDESTPFINKYMFDNIKNSKWILFKDARHSTYIDDETNYLNVLLVFLKN